MAGKLGLPYCSSYFWYIWSVKQIFYNQYTYCIINTLESNTWFYSWDEINTEGKDYQIMHGYSWEAVVVKCIEAGKMNIPKPNEEK